MKSHTEKSLQSPSVAYLEIADTPSVKLDKQRHQLLVLDLNGTLISKIRKCYYTRPHLEEFCEYIYSNFEVMIWSSARKPTVQSMIRIFKDFPPFTLVWDRKHIKLCQEDYAKDVVTVKDLNYIWDTLRHYDATNTIIMDDSPEKLTLHPYNLMKISTFKKGITRRDNDLLKVIQYLEILKYESNVANYIREHPFDTSLSYEVPLNDKEDGLTCFYTETTESMQQLTDSTHTLHYDSTNTKDMNSIFKTRSGRLKDAQAAVKNRAKEALLEMARMSRKKRNMRAAERKRMMRKKVY